jgi:LEA14-like dessication related protein
MRSSVRIRGFAVAAALSLGALVAACASIGRAMFEEPIVTFRNLRVNGVGLEGGSLDVVLGVYNPNGYNLDATRITYELLVGDSTSPVSLGTGALDSRFTAREKDTTEVRLPVTFTYRGIGAAAQQLLRSGTVPYRVKGALSVSTPVGNLTLPYDRTGRFSAFGGAR